jgi:calpain
MKNLGSGLYPPIFHSFSEYGIYVIRFFKDYSWRYVVIDDTLPCKENGEIIYSKCKNPLELWVSIVEKAYAKLHHCY